MVRVYAAEDSDSLSAGLSPCLIAPASLKYLPFLLLPLVAVAISLVAVAVAISPGFESCGTGKGKGSDRVTFSLCETTTPGDDNHLLPSRLS